MSCKQCYHINCVGAEKRYYIMDKDAKAKWKCSSCRSIVENKSPSSSSKSPGSVTSLQSDGAPFTNVTIRSGTLRQNKNASDEICTLSTSSFQSIVDSMKQEVIETLRASIEQLIEKQFNLCMENFVSRLEQLTIAMGKFTSRVDVLEERVKCIEKQLGTCESEQSLTTSLELLKSELNTRDQELLANDVEITGIPETSGENPTHIVTLIGNKLGVKVEERDVVSAVRVGVRRDATVEGGGGGGVGGGGSTGAGRPLAVRLLRRAQRDELLRAARVRRGADTEGFDLSAAPRRFYVNERLTRINRQLFHKVREQKQRLRWRFAWTREGAIFAREDSGKPAVRIRNEADLKRVFGIALVSSG